VFVLLVLAIGIFTLVTVDNNILRPLRSGHTKGVEGRLSREERLSLDRR